MSGNVHIKAWVSPNTKARFAAFARSRRVSESALLKQMVEGAIGSERGPDEAVAPPEPVPSSGRISVRLAVEDLLLLRERARKRGMPSATYVSYLVRSHLRRLAPIPDSELKLLAYAVNQVIAVGRNLNQIARALNSGDMTSGATRGDLRAVLGACTALRDSFNAVLDRNIQSWEAGHDKAGR
jgi:hypothetical protein